MVNKFTREQVSKDLLRILRELHLNAEISEESQYGVDIIIEDEVKALQYYAIRIQLEKLGYLIVDFSLEDCVKAENVRDTVEAIWNDVKYDYCNN
jgi:hypothetical protein